MLTTMVAYLITGDISIYEKQVPTRMDSPAHKDDFALPLLRNMTVRDAMKPLAAQLSTTVIPDTSLRDVAHMMRESNLRDIPVTQNGQIVGIISARDLARMPIATLESDTSHARQAMRRPVARAYPDESLYTAWVRMSRNNLRQLIVVSHDQSAQLIGVLPATSIAKLLRLPETRLPRTQQDAPHKNAHQDPLTDQRVADAMGPAPELIPPSTRLAHVRDRVLEQRVALVANQHGDLWGIITPTDIPGHEHIEQGRELTAGDIAVHDLITASPHESLRAVNRRMIRNGLRQLPVVKGKHVIGLLRRRDVLEAFEREQDGKMSARLETIPGDQH
jgi:CBS domain-containing protein